MFQNRLIRILCNFDCVDACKILVLKSVTDCRVGCLFNMASHLMLLFTPAWAMIMETRRSWIRLMGCYKKGIRHDC